MPGPHDATKCIVERTLYDKVYYQRGLEDSIKRETGKQTVSVADIFRVYERVGVRPPPKTTLRSWHLCVNALHPESFDALKEVFQSSEAQVDSK
ncbi:unnamed protein product, partial [Scytosiphon promiscuus]